MDSNNTKAPEITRKMDNFITRVGHITAWLNVVLIAVIIVQVVLRYAFEMGMVSLEEMQWHLYAVLIMLGLSYDVVHDGHIRLDLLHRKFSKRTKERVEFFGLLFLVAPMVVVIFIHGLDYVGTSIRVGESSDSPLGLPYRWIIKSFIPISMALLGVATVSRMIRAAKTAFCKS
ncbi:TRAP transporter small permease subunit [Dethiosulfatarculus sandiegensis]|uniref:C4-dicarboxylate ABC transporter n=1 Tax=Dethiosulfatarculus sandiegensis TaxID=1429043 RepID=A0A0D2HQK4_9BACT|nr:TRAP transporter small permease subunit [Dethiosulfatarculus sandiegensis]KIX12758.1 C4-dicarboxylate ABC transporter [Dethiosulfatarculus sandiegensis]